MKKIIKKCVICHALSKKKIYKMIFTKHKQMKNASLERVSKVSKK